MPKNDWNQLGNDIKNIVQDAIETGDYGRLNRDLGVTLENALGNMATSVKDAAIKNLNHFSGSQQTANQRRTVSPERQRQEQNMRGYKKKLVKEAREKFALYVNTSTPRALGILFTTLGIALVGMFGVTAATLGIAGIFIDAVVMCPNPEEDHRQTHSFAFDPAYCGDIKVPVSDSDALPMNLRKVIGRRALMELQVNDVLNVGTGIPNDVVGPIISEEGVGDDVTVTVESGIYGGIPMGGIDFGIAKNNFALLRHDDQFDYYNGAGVDVTYMGAGEIDPDGNVNATRLGPNPTGAGGFIDITTNAKHVVFCSSFTGKGLDCSFENGQLHINKEGSLIKFVNKVQQISYNGKIAREKHQKMHYITERAVFELRPEGLVLTEIAPGIDLQTQVLDLMEFKPIISENLKEMNPAIFSEAIPYGLKDIIRNH